MFALRRARLPHAAARRWSRSASSTSSSPTSKLDGEEDGKRKEFKRLAELKEQLAKIDDTKLDEFIFGDGGGKRRRTSSRRRGGKIASKIPSRASGSQSG